MRGNILATENQQARINDVIEVKKACICTKLKQIRLRTTKNTPGSNSGHLDWEPDKMGSFRSFLYLRDVNVMLKIEPAAFPASK